MKVDLYLRQFWHDPRLRYNITNIDSFMLPEHFINNMWTPDLFIENGKEEETHDVTRPNRGYRVYSNGTVRSSERSVPHQIIIILFI